MIIEKMLGKGFFETLNGLKENGQLRFSQLKKYVKNPRTLNLRLRELRDLGLITSIDQSYTLTSRGEEAISILRKLDEILSERDLERWLKLDEVDRIPQKIFRGVVRRYCEILFSYFGKRLVSIVVFGSVARGEAKINESDIDLLIVVDDWSSKVWDRIEEIHKVKSFLETTSEYEILVRKGVWPIFQHYPLTRSEAMEFHRVYLDMIFDRVILYDKESFIENVLSKLRERLEELGSLRVTLPNGAWYWILKPDLKVGETIELKLEE